jgi:hypothetical protein
MKPYNHTAHNMRHGFTFFLCFYYFSVSLSVLMFGLYVVQAMNITGLVKNIYLLWLAEARALTALAHIRYSFSSRALKREYTGNILGVFRPSPEKLTENDSSQTQELYIFGQLRTRSRLILAITHKRNYLSQMLDHHRRCACYNMHAHALCKQHVRLE